MHYSLSVNIADLKSQAIYRLQKMVVLYQQINKWHIFREKFAYCAKS